METEHALKLVKSSIVPATVSAFAQTWQKVTGQLLKWVDLETQVLQYLELCCDPTNELGTAFVRTWNEVNQDFPFILRLLEAIPFNPGNVCIIYCFHACIDSFLQTQEKDTVDASRWITSKSLAVQEGLWLFAITRNGVKLISSITW